MKELNHHKLIAHTMCLSVRKYMCHIMRNGYLCHTIYKLQHEKRYLWVNVNRKDPDQPADIYSWTWTDGLFTMTNSNSFLSPYEILPLTHCILNRLSHTIYWKSPVSILGTPGYEIYIFLEKNGKAIFKQWRPWSDAAFCSVWSGSALFAIYPFTGLPTTMG